MKLQYCFSGLLVSLSVFAIHSVFPASAQEASSNNFAQLQALLAAKKWYEADRETASLIRNNSENLSCPNLSSINRLWTHYSNGKYGLTPQRQIWQQVGGSDCKTCEGEIKKFSQQVGWNLSDQVNPLPGNFVGQYPTVATLGWQRYVDSDRSFLSAGVFSKGTWQAWRIAGFDIFSTLRNCAGQTPTRKVKN